MTEDLTLSEADVAKRFYGYFRSSAAYRCRIAFGLKGVSPDFVPVHLRRDGGEQKKASYRTINPQGLVPALQIGGHVLTQSIAILEWLEETFPEPALLPSDRFARAEARAFALVISADIHPLNNLRVLEYLKNSLGHTQAEADTWYRHWCHEGLSALEALAVRSGYGGTFLFGDTPGLGEVCLIPQLTNARRFGCDTGQFVRLSQIESACASLPAFVAAQPDRQPDGEP